MHVTQGRKRYDKSGEGKTSGQESPGMKMERPKPRWRAVRSQLVLPPCLQRLLGHLLGSPGMILGRPVEPVLKPLGASGACFGPAGGIRGPLGLLS
eukprot:6558068-Pyramimonas_sp.AAC.3